MNVLEMKCLGRLVGVSRMERVRNEVPRRAGIERELARYRKGRERELARWYRKGTCLQGNQWLISAERLSQSWRCWASNPT